MWSKGSWGGAGSRWELMEGNLTRMVLGKYNEGRGTCRSPTGRDLKQRHITVLVDPSGLPVPAACSRGQANGSTSPPAVWAPGSRWVIGAVDSSTRQSLPGPAAHNDLLQGYQTHCHSDSPLQFTSLISLHTGAWPGMGWLTAVPRFVCVRECELVGNNKPLYVVVF